MAIQPEGENLRNAVRWISAERRDNPGAPLYKLIESAGLKFNLSPADERALEEILKGEGSKKG